MGEDGLLASWLWSLFFWASFLVRLYSLAGTPVGAVSGRQVEHTAVPASLTRLQSQSTPAFIVINTLPGLPRQPCGRGLLSRFVLGIRKVGEV